MFDPKTDEYTVGPLRFVAEQHPRLVGGIGIRMNDLVMLWPNDVARLHSWLSYHLDRAHAAGWFAPDPLTTHEEDLVGEFVLFMQRGGKNKDELDA